MRRERIRSSPNCRGVERRDTAFVVIDESKPGMCGMVIARIHLLFSFNYRQQHHSCALVTWYIHTDDKPDKDTGLWIMKLERKRGLPVFQVIDVNTIARGAHLLPVFGGEHVPEDFDFNDALDRYNSFFVNPYIDHHSHDFLTVH